MNLRKYIAPTLGVALVAAAYQGYGWPGVALATGALVMWALLYLNGMLRVLKQAADLPVGYVDSAVMLNAKLKPGVNLLHVIALTRALGTPMSPKDEQPEIFRWTDNSESHVTCEFRDGKLVKWELVRPPVPDAGEAAPPAP